MGIEIDIIPVLVTPRQVFYYLYYLEAKMQEKTAEEIKNQEWANWLLEELQRRTGRHDIEVKVTPYSNHDVLISAAADKHPIVSFLSAMREDSPRVAQALDYTSEMLQSWEVNMVIHEKAKQDCLPFYERLQREFPHMVHEYNVVDVGKHSARVTKVDDKIVSFFDLWPQMTEVDVKRLISYIEDLEATLDRENATYAEMTYWWN